MRVLISGAGVAGPTLAYFLGRAGMKVTVVEKAPALLPHGQNVDIQGSAVTVIRKMGLLEEFKRRNTTETGTQFVHQNGKTFAAFPICDGSTASLSSEFEILRGDLAMILFKQADEVPNVDFLFDTTIKSVIKNDDTSVEVELSNGDITEYDVLVAADGQWSKTRKQCFSDEAISVVDKDMFVVYYTIPRQTGDNDYWNIYWSLKRRLVTLRPDPYGTVRAMFSFMPSSDLQRDEWRKAIRADAKAQKELLKREFADAGWQTERVLAAADQAPDFYFQAMQQIRMDRWYNGRVICLGDAAHAPTPLTGAGTTLAMTGAYILAGELEKLQQQGLHHPDKAFQAYSAVYRPFVEKMQTILPIIPGIAHPTTYWQRWLLQTFASTMSTAVYLVRSVPYLAKRIMTQSNEENDDGFPLPIYEGLDERCPSSP